MEETTVEYEPKHAATQVDQPWRAVVRTVFQMVLAVAAFAPAVYTAITQGDPAAATGWAAGGLAFAGAITRVMALPAVEGFLRVYVPWLAADGS